MCKSYIKSHFVSGQARKSKGSSTTEQSTTRSAGRIRTKAEQFGNDGNKDFLTKVPGITKDRFEESE
jgi:hypothetical protein